MTVHWLLLGSKTTLDLIDFHCVGKNSNDQNQNKIIFFYVPQKKEKKARHKLNFQFWVNYPLKFREIIFPEIISNPNLASIWSRFEMISVNHKAIKTYPY